MADTTQITTHDSFDDLWPTNSRLMAISPNLSAALEFDEQSRATVAGPSRRSLDTNPPLVGLPPPPRPKSRATSVRIHSPTSSTTLALHATTSIDAQTQPQPPPTPQSPAVQSFAGTSSNPYINPPPRLPLLVMDSQAGVASPTDRRSISGYSPRSSIDSRLGDSPRSETRPSGSPLTSSPDSAGLSEGRQGFQRHLRYLSSLSKVDKILGIGKTFGNGKNRDSCGGRRASEISLADTEGRKGSRRSSGSSSRPGSPIIFAEMVAGHTATSTPQEDRDRRRSSVVAPASGAASALATRPLISHGRTHSAASTLRSAASSESSHEPPSTPNDTARISISSTLYQDSHYSIPFDPPYSAPLPLSQIHLQQNQSHLQQNTMSSPGSDRESFIDLASPRSPDFDDRNFRATQPAPSDRYSYRKDLANLADLSLQPSPPIMSTVTAKPPLPTSPKPAFSKRSHSAQPPRDRPRSPDRQDVNNRTFRPSTTNLLAAKERADRVRQNRKLAQVFGQNPASIEVATVDHDVGVPSGLLCAPGSNLMPGIAAKRKQQHLRGAVSMSVNTSGTREQLPRVAWPPPDGTKHLTLSARRHSSPLTPDVMTFLDGPATVDDGDDDEHALHSSGVIVIGSHADFIDDDFRKPPRHKRSSSALTSPTSTTALTSPTSFIDLSEEDLAGDGIINLETPTASRRPPLATSPSSASIYSFTDDQLAEEERRRKREKLAKLHRFLGSRVPADVILGQLSIDTALQLPPPATSTVSAVERPKQMDPDARKNWVRRRRSSSAAEFSGKWSDEIDRLKEELNDKEKAQNVKRAVKMEKMFGVAPPQTLYHTRAAPGSAASPSYKQHRSSSYSPGSPHDLPSRNLNQSAYTRNKVKRKSNRPGTAESSEPLMNGFGEDSHHRFGFSEVYEHYRHSLNSLNDIIDRDDKASLERLHDFIHGDSHDHAAHLQTFTRLEEPLEEPSTPKAERRRSLPARASMTSLASEFSIAASITSPDPEETMFQTRRRRAAKLTQFFGVDYRELMCEILDSLEKGLEEESGRGTLKPDEVQELLVKLRKLKTKRNNFLG